MPRPVSFSVRICRVSPVIYKLNLSLFLFRPAAHGWESKNPRLHARPLRGAAYRQKDEPVFVASAPCALRRAC